ncbi:MAG: carbon storage regulator, partial [Nitrospirales bacterium]
MLILTRKEGEGIRLGDDIRIVLVQLRGNQVRLGIECPKNMRV